MKLVESTHPYSGAKIHIDVISKRVAFYTLETSMFFIKVEDTEAMREFTAACQKITEYKNLPEFFQEQGVTVELNPKLPVADLQGKLDADLVTYILLLANKWAQELEATPHALSFGHFIWAKVISDPRYGYSFNWDTKTIKVDPISAYPSELIDPIILGDMMGEEFNTQIETALGDQQIVEKLKDAGINV